MSNNALDIVTRELTSKVSEMVEKQVQARVQEALNGVQAEVSARIDALVSEIPAIAAMSAEHQPEQPLADPGVSVRTDARNRAWRTLLQGLVVTVFVAATGAFATAVGKDGFDFGEWESWRLAVNAGMTAALMSVVAYVQRFLNPPKG